VKRSALGVGGSSSSCGTTTFTNRKLVWSVLERIPVQSGDAKAVVATQEKLEATWQKLTASKDERISVQKSLDKAVAELLQMSQRLRETDKTFDEAKQKYDSDIALHEMNYEALKTRAELTHKLLEDTRNGMLERVKEIQSSIAA
jgi:septal ring factor EnvC (AmiA/AmiB activator)